MPDNDALCPQIRLNDSVVCQQVARFLQETESDARTRGLAVAVVGPVIVDGLAIGGVGISGLPPALDAELAARFVQRLT